MKRRKTQPSTAPPPPKRERFLPTWHRDKRRSAHSAVTRVSTFLEHVEAGDFRLPALQRPWRWSDADIISLLTSIFDGEYVGTLLTWERSGLEPSVERFGEHTVMCSSKSAYYVIDGQHRIGALCTAVHSGRFFFDLQAGEFVIGATGPWRCPVSRMLSRRIGDELWWFDGHATEHGLDRERVFDLWACAVDQMEHAEIHACRLDYRWTLQQVVETYRRMNTTGVRVSAEDLEDGLRRALA